MKSRLISAIVMGLFSVLAALIGAQLLGGNVALQVGGSGNKIEQKVEYTPQTQKQLQ